MKLFLVLIFIASATAAPQHGSGRAIKSFADEFRAGLVNIPEGCTFISQTQETVNGVIKGEYTYEDPIGSQITVTYSVNVDGSNYVEKRKILKAYDTDGASNLLTAEEVVLQVSTELKPTIIRIIKTTVESSNVDLNNYGNLVEVILTQLKPVVQASVNSALSTSPHDHLDENDLVAKILIALRPFVEESLRKEIKAKAPKISEEDIVQIVIKQLENTVISVIKAAVSASKDVKLAEQSHQDKLVQTIVTQLRPVVLQSVKSAIVANNAQQYNAQSLSERIVKELIPFVRRGVGAQILELQKQQQITTQKIVSSVIQDLRPIIIRIIRESVRNYKGDLSKYGNLVETIMVQLRPVVLAEVRRALAVSTDPGHNALSAEEITEKIMLQLRGFVEEGVREQVKILEEELKISHDQVVEDVINGLRPIIIRVIRETVRSSNADLNNYKNLVQTIINQLRPVVLSTVTTEIAKSPKNAHLNARELTEEILLKITPFVREAVSQQIKELEAENRVTPEEIVDNVIAQLKPITIKVIRQTVHGKNGVNINDEEGLVQTIVSQLRPVVFAQVSAAITANKANYDAKSISEQIVVRLIPFIREGVRREVQIEKEKGHGNLVKDIIEKLNPHIDDSIHDALGGRQVGELDAGQETTVLSNVLGKLRSIILNAVNTVMARLQASGEAHTLSIEAIIAKVNTEIKNQLLLQLLGDEVSGLFQGKEASGDLLQALLQKLLPRIDAMIRQMIQQWRISNPHNPTLSSSQQSQVVSGVVSSLRGQIEASTNSFLAQSPNTIQDSAVVEAIIGQYQPTIISTLQGNRVIQQVFANANFASSDAYEALLNQIMQRLRAIILQVIRAYRASQVVITTTPKPAGNAIVNIFGTGGANSVQVETPNYQYDYTHDKKRK